MIYINKNHGYNYLITNSICHNSFGVMQIIKTNCKNCSGATPRIESIVRSIRDRSNYSINVNHLTLVYYWLRGFFPKKIVHRMSLDFECEGLLITFKRAILLHLETFFSLMPGLMFLRIKQTSLHRSLLTTIWGQYFVKRCPICCKQKYYPCASTACHSNAVLSRISGIVLRMCCINECPPLIRIDCVCFCCHIILK